MPALVLSLPKGETRVVTITRRTMIGRASDCELQLKFDGVSRKHAQLVEGELGRWTIHDAGSRHGTRVNGVRLVESRRLEHRDEIQVGEVRMTFLERSPEESASSRVSFAPVSNELKVRQTFESEETSDFDPQFLIADVEVLRVEYEKLRLAQLLSTRLAAGVELDVALQLVLDFCAATLEVEEGVVLFRSQPSERLRPRAVLGPVDARIIASESVLSLVSSSRNGLLVEDAIQDPGLGSAVSILARGVRSILAVPLVVENDLVGAIYLQNSVDAAFQRSDLRLMMGIAEQVSAALQRKRLADRIASAKRLRRDLSRFLPPAVVEAVEQGRLRVERGGERGGEIADVTLLFSDIRGFTTLSEFIGPTASMRLLNAYFEEMVEAVFNHSGTVDKYMGDGLVAMWGAPAREPRAAELALRCALDMQTRLRRFNKERTDRGERMIHVGIGIHRGPALVGLLGAQARLEFTAIGDTVNTASRLCEAAAGGEVLASSGALEGLEDDFDFGEQRVFNLKGRSAPLSAVLVKSWNGSGGSSS